MLDLDHTRDMIERAGVPCGACGGSGRVLIRSCLLWANCFTCKGTGWDIPPKPDPETEHIARAKAALGEE